MITYTYNATTLFECEENSLLDLAIKSIVTLERTRQTKALTALINNSKPIKLLPRKPTKDILTVLKKG